MTNLTPDEIVTLETVKKVSLNEIKFTFFSQSLKKYQLYSTLGFYSIAFAVMFQNRSFITKFYFFSSVFIGGFFGFFLGALLNTKKSVVLFDKLGKEFEISRNTKQAILSKRKDLTEIEKSEIMQKHRQDNDLQLIKMVGKSLEDLQY